MKIAIKTLNPNSHMRYGTMVSALQSQEKVKLNRENSELGYRFNVGKQFYANHDLRTRRDIVRVRRKPGVIKNISCFRHKMKCSP